MPGKTRFLFIKVPVIRLFRGYLQSEQEDGLEWGFGQGSPNMIPFVKQDYMFAAICEELGGLFAMCLILICMSLFVLVVNISLQINDRFIN